MCTLYASHTHLILSTRQSLAIYLFISHLKIQGKGIKFIVDSRTKTSRFLKTAR